MEILYDFFDFIDKLKRHLQTVAPLRSAKRQEELNFYHQRARPDSARSITSYDSAVVMSPGTRVTTKQKSDID
jgi:hypothetical protein